MALSLVSRAAESESMPECRSLSDPANSLCELFFLEPRQEESIDTNRKSIPTITLTPCGWRLKTAHINLFLFLLIQQDDDAKTVNDSTLSFPFVLIWSEFFSYCGSHIRDTDTFKA